MLRRGRDRGEQVEVIAHEKRVALQRTDIIRFTLLSVITRAKLLKI